MYRKVLLASVGAIALTGPAAFAADLPYRGPPPVYLPPPPIFTWTGIYIGAQIGYAWGNDHDDLFETSAGVPVFIAGLGSFSDSPQGVIGGGHVGYNLQFNQWVIGLEGSVDGTSLSRTVVLPFGAANFVTATSRADVQGSIRGRAGIAWDRALLYATGGVAFSGITNTITDTTGFFTGTTGSSASFSNTRVGWTVGGGIAYALTNNWSVRAEYRYSDFGRVTDSLFVGIITAPLGLTSRHHLTENQVQVGVSYKFDTWAPYPVVAKY